MYIFFLLEFEFEGLISPPPPDRCSAWMRFLKRITYPSTSECMYSPPHDLASTCLKGCLSSYRFFSTKMVYLPELTYPFRWARSYHRPLDKDSSCPPPIWPWSKPNIITITKALLRHQKPKIYSGCSRKAFGSWADYNSGLYQSFT